jgi:Histidine kinase-, DNA gyrase B-, and HSP90-like ATPase
MTQFPEIDYKHVLSELSVNRKDPCEVVRELISNSYDAQSLTIKIYPLLQYKGFVFFDNGTGLSGTEVINKITPYKAFFSIGKSTKIQGEFIGYKCQGSKLCFASSKFTLITRCKNEKNWRSISIDNPKDNLSPQYNIESEIDDTPWKTLKDLFSTPKTQAATILEEMNEDFFLKEFSHGAMIIVQGLDVQDFSKYYDSEEKPNTKWSYLKHYIRYNTRHGDTRILRSSETDFPSAQEKVFAELPGYNKECKLYLWTGVKCERVESGYPYLNKPNELEKALIRSPAQISRLRDGSFSARAANSFRFEGIGYSLTLAIDGNGRALKKYEELDRQGSRKSGIKLTDQRGVFICSDGVKICQYNEIFERSLLSDYAVLGTSDAKHHYIFAINGTFDVVTNRTSITESALKTLNDDSFIEKVKKFLDAAKLNNECFRELINRLNKENQSRKLEDYTQKLNLLKEGISDRNRFKINNVNQLTGQWFIEPASGEEYSVGILYAMLAHFVTPDSPHAHLWLRPRTFSSMGIDSIAVEIGEESLNAKVHKTLEYKYAFSSNDEFNHPLILTDQIVCWDIQTGIEGATINDSYNYYGIISFASELEEIGYKITKISSRDGDDYNGEVKVISLKNLLMKTFECEWKSPPPRTVNATTRQKRKKIT